jgi:hypothetical protein
VATSRQLAEALFELEETRNLARHAHGLAALFGRYRSLLERGGVDASRGGFSKIE